MIRLPLALPNNTSKFSSNAEKLTSLAALASRVVTRWPRTGVGRSTTIYRKRTMKVRVSTSWIKISCAKNMVHPPLNSTQLCSSSRYSLREGVGVGGVAKRSYSLPSQTIMYIVLNIGDLGPSPGYTEEIIYYSIHSHLTQCARSSLAQRALQLTFPPSHTHKRNRWRYKRDSRVNSHN